MKRLIPLLGVLVLLFTTCKPSDNTHIQNLCVEQGKNAFRPRENTWWRESSVGYNYKFDESASYFFADSDQCDWNKLGGFSFRLLTNHKHAIMTAWRWDVAGYWIITPYYHLDGETYFDNVPCTGYNWPVDDDAKYLRIDLGESFEVHYSIQEPERRIVSVYVIDEGGESFYFEQDFGFEIKQIREIYPWFGGTKDAPHKMCIIRELLDRE